MYELHVRQTLTPGTLVIWPTMVNIFYIGPGVSRSTELLLTLPPNVGLVFGSLCLMAFGNVIGHWKWTLAVTWFGMVLFGALMGLVTPFNQNMMIAFCCINASKSFRHLKLQQKHFY